MAASRAPVDCLLDVDAPAEATSGRSQDAEPGAGTGLGAATTGSFLIEFFLG
jgi:hypothetical protein